MAVFEAAEDRAMGEKMRIVMLGPPGSGKGTQAERLARDLGVPWISTGQMLRDAVSRGSDLGTRVSGLLDAGQLVDDDTMADVVRERLAQDDTVAGFLLDGYPRTEAQADTLGRILDDRGESLSCVLFIDVPEKELMKRALVRNRGADDREEVVMSRLEVYAEKTEPLIEYYKRFGLLEPINGDQSIDEVSKEIATKLAATV